MKKLLILAILLASTSFTGLIAEAKIFSLIQFKNCIWG